MKTPQQLLAILLAIAASTSLAAGSPEPPRPATNDFILRTPAAEIDGIAARHGLEIVARVDTAPDAEGNSVYLVRAPSAAPPALIVEDIFALEPAAAGIEEAILASLPESGGDVDLDQRGMNILNALAQAELFSPPSSIFDSDWKGPVSDRELDPDLSRGLRLEMERGLSGEGGDYRLAVGFAEGCALELAGDSVRVGSGLGFKNKSVTWQIQNLTSQTVALESLTLRWPAKNKDLLNVKLAEKEIFDQRLEPGSAIIDSGWKAGGWRDREIGPGQTGQLTLQFENQPSRRQSSYSLAVGVSFAALEQGCHVRAEGQLGFGSSSVSWQITNAGSNKVTLNHVAVAWPPADGSLQRVLWGGKDLVEPVLVPHGRNADGTPRFLWSAFVAQPAAGLLQMAAAQSSHQGKGIVAVIDSGVDPGHPLFAHRLLPGHDFVRGVSGEASEWTDVDQRGMNILNGQEMTVLGSENVLQLNASTAAVLSGAEELDPGSLPPAFGHGTMVAGIVHLVAPEASILPLRAFDAEGHGHLFDIVEAIYYAVDQGAEVINMSFSLESFSPELMRAVNHAARRGVTCVASAGNDGDEVMVYPAALGNTIGVASTTAGDALSPFSNLGSDLVTIAAPGEDVVTSYPGGGWAVVSGTSFAAPWISGAAALFVDKNDGAQEIGRAGFYLASEALSHARPIQGDGAGRAGYGRADLEAAVANLRGGVVVDDEPAGAYSIVVEFTEGCTVEYPPAASGSGCSASPATQLSFRGKRMDLKITNAGNETITVERITVSWPQENGHLKKVKLDGDIFTQPQQPGTTTIDSGWEDPAENRQIAPRKRQTLRFDFANSAIKS